MQCLSHEAVEHTGQRQCLSREVVELTGQRQWLTLRGRSRGQDAAAGDPERQWKFKERQGRCSGEAGEWPTRFAMRLLGSIKEERVE